MKTKSRIWAMVITMSAIIIVCACGSNGSDNDNNQGNNSNQCTNYSKNVSVSAELPWPDVWTNTNVSLSSGAELNISASGQIGYDSSSDTCGPDGLSSSKGSPPLPNQNGASLIGKIGENGNPFFIGSSYSSTVSSSGILYLSINDQNNVYTWGDNTGSFQATINYCQ